MRVSPVGPTGQTVSSIRASWSCIGCDCNPVRTWCASVGLSWLSGGPLKLLMNACVVGSSVMEHLLDCVFAISPNGFACLRLRTADHGSPNPSEQQHPGRHRIERIHWSAPQVGCGTCDASGRVQYRFSEPG